MTIKAGDRYIHDGIIVDVHEVFDGMVYYRQWPKDTTEINWLDGLFKISLMQFLIGIGKRGLTPVKEDKA